MNADLNSFFAAVPFKANSWNSSRLSKAPTDRTGDDLMNPEPNGLRQELCVKMATNRLPYIEL
jgi:hypothetical protein